MGRFAVALLLIYAVAITVLFVQPDKSERVCVPLYDETGLECCQ